MGCGVEFSSMFMFTFWIVVIVFQIYNYNKQIQILKIFLGSFSWPVFALTCLFKLPMPVKLL